MSNDKHAPIAQALYLLSRTHGRTFLLLDRFASSPLSDAIEALDPPPATSVLDDPFFRDDLASAPLLVELLHSEDSHHALLAASIDLALEEAPHLRGLRTVCGWLYAGAPLNRLQRALRQRLSAHYPDGEQIYLRYFDPRVLPHLPPLLAGSGGSGKEQLLGPVETWCYLDWEGELQQIDNADSSHPGAGAPLRFDAAAAAAIERIGTINMTFGKLRQLGTPCSPSDGRAIDQHVIAAQQLGLRDSDDQLAYAWRAVHYGSAFMVDPQIATWAAQVDALSVPFDALLEHAYPAAIAHSAT